MNIYSSLYELINTYLFGGNSLDVGSNAELICMLLSSMGCIFLIALPFLVVFKILKLILG